MYKVLPIKNDLSQDKDLQLAFNIINQDYKNIDKMYILVNLCRGEFIAKKFLNNLFVNLAGLSSITEPQDLFLGMFLYFKETQPAVGLALAQTTNDSSFYKTTSVINLALESDLIIQKKINTVTVSRWIMGLYVLNDEKEYFLKLSEKNLLANVALVHKNPQLVKRGLLGYLSHLNFKMSSVKMMGILDVIYKEWGKNEDVAFSDGVSFSIFYKTLSANQNLKINEGFFYNRMREVISQSCLKFKTSLIIYFFQNSYSLSDSIFSSEKELNKSISKLLENNDVLKFIKENNIIIPFIPLLLQLNNSNLRIMIKNNESDSVLNNIENFCTKLFYGIPNRLVTFQGLLNGKNNINSKAIDYKLLFDFVLLPHDDLDIFQSYSNAINFLGKINFVKEFCLILNNLHEIISGRLPLKNQSQCYQSECMLKLLKTSFNTFLEFKQHVSNILSFVVENNLLSIEDFRLVLEDLDIDIKNVEFLNLYYDSNFNSFNKLLNPDDSNNLILDF